MNDAERLHSKRIFTSPLWVVLSMGLVLGCMTQPEQDTFTDKEGQGLSALEPENGADAYVTIDCLLPGQIRRLGTHVTFVTARRPTRTTAEDCAIRGGEYTLADRADYQTSLKLWLDAAQDGDAQAQYYVGTIYEKGPRGKPDYALAGVWYQKAAEQGHHQAAMNLGRLYEQGLGVTKSASTAFKWYAEASGLEESSLSMLMNVKASSRIQQLEQTVHEREQEIHRLQAHINEISKELTQLRNQLHQRSSEAETEQKKLLSLQTRYDRLEQQLNTKQAKQDTSEQLNRELKALRMKVESQQALVSQREQEVKQLHQHIASLEEEVAQRTQELESTPSVDLGFEGPIIELIDPLLPPSRGISVVGRVPSIPAPVGVSRHISGRVIAPAGLRALTINGHVVQVDDQGIFTMDFPPLRAAQDTFPVQILAVDIQDKRATKKLMLVAGKTVVRAQPMADEDMAVFGNYYALVIGNDRYQHWNPLRNAVSDAQAVANVLEAQYGFMVTFLKDATRREILKALNNFRKSLKENDNLLVYYAGHGHLESDIDRGYWIPIDAEIDDTSQWILTPNITDLLELMSAKHVLVIADSCFAGKLTRSSLAKLRPGLSDDARMKMLKTVAKKRVRTALTSGGEHPVLDVGEDGHSVFTGALLDVLGENQAIIETERLFLAIRTRVVKAADQYKMEQVPTYWPIQFAGHESLGDFIFVPHQS